MSTSSFTLPEQLTHTLPNPRADMSTFSNKSSFEFGRGDELPSHVQAARQGDSRRRRSIFRKLALCDDYDLLDYLGQRRVSPGFLIEIDIFLENHPELGQHAPRFVEEMNTASPLQAYRLFMKGYTRPARYLRGIIPEFEFTLPTGCFIISIVDKRDEELDEFFRGYEYRWDILDKIDAEVMVLVRILESGGRVNRTQRLLVSYHLWGNPVDAFKWYEYNYQEEWLTHRYLPEHVLLSDVPKDDGYVAPSPHVMTGPGEDISESDRRFRNVRYHMARANDQGVDVIDVLLEQFVSAVAKRGLSRVQIEEKRQEALDVIGQMSEERSDKDVVNVIMDMAMAIPHHGPRYERTLHFSGGIPGQHTIFPNFNFVVPGHVSRPIKHQIKLEKRQFRLNVAAGTKGAPRGPKAGVTTARASMFEAGKKKSLQSRRDNLRELRSGLEKLYRQEKDASTPEIKIVESRRRAEREFVRALLGYMDAGGKASIGMTATEVGRMYNKEYITEKRQIEAEEKGMRRTHLLSLFPPELKG